MLKTNSIVLPNKEVSILCFGRGHKRRNLKCQNGKGTCRDKVYANEDILSTQFVGLKKKKDFT